MNLFSSLKAKILCLLVLPMGAALLLAGSLISREWGLYQTALNDMSHGEMIHSVSVLIHEVQGERGKSAMYLGGNTTLDDLNSQREHVNIQWKKISERLKDSHLRSDVVTAASPLQSALEQIRSRVDRKEEASGISQSYGKLIDNMISLEVLAARDGTFEVHLSGPITLDVAKEDAGKVRAVVTNILTANKAISLGQFATLQSLMSGINGNLHSPLLKVSKDGAVRIEKFNASEDWKIVQQVFQRVSDRAAEGNYEQDPKVFYSAVTRSIDALSEIVQGDLTQVKDRIEEGKSAAERAMIIVMVLSLVGTISIGLFAALVIRAITKPIQQAVGELGQSADQVMSAFEQLRAANHQISSGTSQSAASLEETVASVEEISGMISSNAESARQATDISKEGYDRAVKGEMEMQTLRVSMEDLSNSSKKIEAIVTIIDDIAFQINLLALNAAVEAARAGEQGKGFAVVAEAVRELAQKSAVAAQDIGQLIQESVGKTKQGHEAANSSGQALMTIVEAVKSTSSLIEEISNSSQEQSKGLSQITKAMNELDGATQTNAASAEEASASAEALAEQAHLMKDLVQRLNQIVEGNKFVARIQPEKEPEFHSSRPEKSKSVKEFKSKEAKKPIGRKSVDLDAEDFKSEFKRSA